MNGIMLSIIAVSAIGLLCAIMLTVVSKLMGVEEDERVTDVREALPGANCGACGFAGCDGYAAALVNDGARTNLCAPGGDSVSRRISDILGVEFADVVEQVSVCHCAGAEGIVVKKMDYDGVKSCAAAKMHYSGEGACAYGCMSYGDCAKACPTGAICVEDGVARVNTALCIGCGMCVKTCPNALLRMHGDTIRVIIACSSHARGAEVRKSCSAGCIGCGRCEKECPENAITIEDNLAVIDYDKCTGCGHCAQICPTNAIRVADFSGALK